MVLFVSQPAPLIRVCGCRWGLRDVCGVGGGHRHHRTPLRLPVLPLGRGQPRQHAAALRRRPQRPHLGPAPAARRGRPSRRQQVRLHGLPHPHLLTCLPFGSVQDSTRSPLPCALCIPDRDGLDAQDIAAGRENAGVLATLEAADAARRRCPLLFSLSRSPLHLASLHAFGVSPLLRHRTLLRAVH